jgi:hypothetical protein
MLLRLPFTVGFHFTNTALATRERGVKGRMGADLCSESTHWQSVAHSSFAARNVERAQNIKIGLGSPDDLKRHCPHACTLLVMLCVDLMTEPYARPSR